MKPKKRSTWLKSTFDAVEEIFNDFRREQKFDEMLQARKVLKELAVLMNMLEDKQ